jgi:hypothetical protein
MSPDSLDGRFRYDLQALKPVETRSTKRLRRFTTGFSVGSVDSKAGATVQRSCTDAAYKTSHYTRPSTGSVPTIVSQGQIERSELSIFDIDS